MNQPTKEVVRNAYAQVATRDSSCCAPSCCGESAIPNFDVAAIAEKLGYTADDIEAGGGANLGLGCGNPVALADIREGETVLDLGSGAGFDAFLAADRVGTNGRVIGVDMTPEMLERATASAQERGIDHVEFRLGDIEALPVEDNSVDLIISNCVVNLAPNKDRVMIEAFRVLQPGGRLHISDVLAIQPLPESVQNDARLLAGCIGGAAEVATMEKFLQDAGFESIEVTVNEASRAFIAEWAPGTGLENYVASATIRAQKPS